MNRYLQIYWMMMRNSLIREMSFKANFILWMFVELLWFVGQIVFIQVMFSYVDKIGDWSKWEVVLLVGTHQLIGQIFQAFFYVNIANLPELVRTGKLDFMLLLPVDSQFAVSTRQFGMDNIINALVGVGIVVFSLAKLSVVPGVVQILLYLVAIALGVAVHYSIMFFLATMSFWIVRAQGLIYGYFNLFNIARYPDADFRRVVQAGLQLDRPGDHRGEHPGPDPDALARAALAPAPATGGGLPVCGGGEPDFLAIRPEALLKRQFIEKGGFLPP